MRYSRFKNYTTLKYVILLGALIVAITDWGSPASLITIVLVILTGIIFPFIKYVWKRRRPSFKSIYKKDVTLNMGYKDAEIDNQILPTEEWLCTNTELSLAQSSEYSIYLDLVPKVSQELSMVDVRFVPEINQPEITFFQDLTPPARLHNKPSHKRPVIKAMALNYDPFMPVVKGGKALDYLVNVKTYSEWRGKLSLQFSFVHEGVKYIRIKVKVK
ncbi:MAG: hypothetical protein ABIH70_01165 [Chloroflexota bacterium]